MDWRSHHIRKLAGSTVGFVLMMLIGFNSYAQWTQILERNDSYLDELALTGDGHLLWTIDEFREIDSIPAAWCYLRTGKLRLGTGDVDSASYIDMNGNLAPPWSPCQHVFDIAAPSPQVSYRAETDGWLSRSVDSGKTYVVTHRFGWLNGRSLAFLNDSVGFIASGAVIARTTDMGISSELVYQRSEPAPYSYAIFLFNWDGHTVYAGIRNDDSPTLFMKSSTHTDASGSTVMAGDVWDTLSFYPGDLLKVEFVNSNTGVAVGPNGTAIKTVDGGYTWANLNAPTDLRLIDLAMVDAQTFWVCGGNLERRQMAGDTVGGCWYTLDGGENWHHDFDTEKTVPEIIYDGDSTLYAIHALGIFSRKLPVPSSLEANEHPLRLSAYPNPASNAVAVKSNGLHISSLQLIGMDGRLWRTASTNAAAFTLDVSDVPNGQYIVVAQLQSGHLQRARVVVAH